MTEMFFTVVIFGIGIAMVGFLVVYVAVLLWGGVVELFIEPFKEDIARRVRIQTKNERDRRPIKKKYEEWNGYDE